MHTIGTLKMNCKLHIISDHGSMKIFRARKSTSTIIRTYLRFREEKINSVYPLHIRQKRRSAANARERKRMTNLNDAFEKLCLRALV